MEFVERCIVLFMFCEVVIQNKECTSGVAMKGNANNKMTIRYDQERAKQASAHCCRYPLAIEGGRQADGADAHHEPHRPSNEVKEKGKKRKRDQLRPAILAASKPNP